MGIMSWLRKRGRTVKMVALAATISAAVTLQACMDKITKEHNESKKDPIMQVVRDSTSKYYGMLSLADASIRSNDLVGIKESIKELDEANKNLKNALYDNSDLKYLADKGWLTYGEMEGAINFRKQIQQVRTALANKAEDLKGHK